MDVALLGVVEHGIENHSLAVLGQALSEAGFEHAVVPFRGFAGMHEMLADIARLRPRICGVSLQTSEAALAALTFTRLLRARGYDGLIVIGGHFASMSPDEILAAPAGVDVVVQLAGEQALVGLARGDEPERLPGTVTRQGRGAPAVPVRPRAIRRDKLAEHLGFGAADLVASRGCEAHCGYCCVAAISDLGERTSGVRYARTAMDELADEIAELAGRGVRAFHFMDDNLLPLAPAAALAWARSFQDALIARRLPRIAFSLQLRADIVTPELAEVLVELGLARAYVGIDGYSNTHLRAIGRSSPATAGPAALELLSARGVYCVANALLVGPTIRFESIVGEIDGLEMVRHAPVHLLPIEARPGTVYHRRASARGLIEGGLLWPAYRFEDHRAFLVAEVITNLPTRLTERSVPIALYDLAWGLGVARRLAPTAETTRAATTYATVTAAWNQDQIRVLRAAAAAALRGPAAISDLIATERPFVRVHDEALLHACDRALVDVERSLSAIHHRRVRAHGRGRVLGSLAVAMGLASACDHGSRIQRDAAVDVAVTPDVLPECLDETRTSAGDPDPIEYDCSCGQAGQTQVKVTFNDRGEITEIRDLDGAPLPGDLEQCLLALVATYCYPTHAGTTQDMTTCHAWIA